MGKVKDFLMDYEEKHWKDVVIKLLQQEKYFNMFMQLLNARVNGIEDLMNIDDIYEEFTTRGDVIKEYVVLLSEMGQIALDNSTTLVGDNDESD